VARALQLRYLAAPTHNAELAALFRELLRLETAFHASASEEARHNRTQGFARAAAVLRAAPAPITSLAMLQQMQLPFLGPDCVGFIAEFFRTGRIERLEERRRDELLVTKALFMKVPCVGPDFARLWAETPHGHRSLGDLQRAYVAGNLCDQDKLSDMAAAAIPFGDELLAPILLSEFTELHDAVEQAAREVDKTLQCELTGGYSRRLVTPNGVVLEPHAEQADSSYHDVDVLVKFDDRNTMYAGGADWALTELVKHLRKRKRLGVLAAHITGSDVSGLVVMKRVWPHISGLAPVGSANIDSFRKAFLTLQLPGKPPRRVDVVFVPASQYAFAILGWTGSRQFERWIRIYVRLAWLPIPRRHRCLVYCAALMQALTQRNMRPCRPRSRSRRYG
jgi:DNA polymerase mu